MNHVSQADPGGGSGRSRTGCAAGRRRGPPDGASAWARWRRTRAGKRSPLRWAELEALYVEELTSGKAVRLYAALKESLA